MITEYVMIDIHYCQIHLQIYVTEHSLVFFNLFFYQICSLITKMIHFFLVEK